MGLFLVIVMSFGFGAATLEKSKDICAPDRITKECFLEALEPVTRAPMTQDIYKSTMND